MDEGIVIFIVLAMLVVLAVLLGNMRSRWEFARSARQYAATNDALKEQREKGIWANYEAMMETEYQVTLPDPLKPGEMQFRTYSSVTMRAGTDGVLYIYKVQKPFRAPNGEMVFCNTLLEAVAAGRWVRFIVTKQPEPRAI